MVAEKTEKDITVLLFCRTLYMISYW